MAEIKRKKGENFETFLRRFNKALKNSRRLFSARDRLYHKKENNKELTKRNALHSMKLREKKEYLRKIGKLEESAGNRRR